MSVLLRLAPCSHISRFINLIPAAALVFLSPRPASAVHYSVHPGVVEGPPAVLFSAPHAADITTTFTSLSEPTTPILTTRRDLNTTSIRIELPKVEQDTYVEIACTTASEIAAPEFTWRTLARPAGEPLMQYTGRQEMLPSSDFDVYWARAKKELAQVTTAPAVTRVPDKDTSTGLLFRVELASVQDTTIVCWYYVPRLAFRSENETTKSIRRFPAILIAPGYGAEEPPIDRTSDGYITLSVNPRNHGPSRAYWKSPVEHLVYNIMDSESYYYRLAFLDCLRAAQFLFSRPEVDRKRVATEGGSQGGLFAIATAALEPRIACVCANIPAFCDYPDAVVLATKGHSGIRDLLRSDETTAAQVRKTLSYVDGANMITRCKSPVQICMGDQDPVCPYVTGIVLVNRLPKGVQREFRVALDCNHAVPPVMREWNRSWYQRWLKPTVKQ